MDIVDLRGRIPPAVPTPVLADPSGKRARRLALLGRAVALLFTLWLLGLLFAGLGILPAGLIPLGHSVGLQSLPTLPTLPSFPAPQPPSKSDLAAAKPLNSSAAGTTAGVHGSSATVAGGLIAGLPGAALGQRGAPGHGNGHGVSSIPVNVGGNPATPNASAGPRAGPGTHP